MGWLQAKKKEHPLLTWNTLYVKRFKTKQDYYEDLT